MRNAANRALRGFTLIEMLVVVAIIGILMALVGSAAYSAHQRAYVTRANAEAQQIATAFKSYWIAKNKWPTGFSGGGYTALTRKNLKPLMGGDSDGTVYLDVPPDNFDGDGEDAPFLDPWGNPYAVHVDKVEDTTTSDTLEGVVSFPNYMRHYYEEGVYVPGAKFGWDRYKSESH